MIWSLLLSIVARYDRVYQYSVVTGNRYREPPVSAVRFPIPDDLVNYTKDSMDSAQINLPPSLIQERMTEMDDNGE